MSRADHEEAKAEMMRTAKTAVPIIDRIVLDPDYRPSLAEVSDDLEPWDESFSAAEPDEETTA